MTKQTEHKTSLPPIPKQNIKFHYTSTSTKMEKQDIKLIPWPRDTRGQQKDRLELQGTEDWPLKISTQTWMPSAFLFWTHLYFFRSANLTSLFFFLCHLFLSKGLPRPLSSSKMTLVMFMLLQRTLSSSKMILRQVHDTDTWFVRSHIRPWFMISMHPKQSWFIIILGLWLSVH